MADIFISYAREDRDSAARLATLLQEQGYSVWWDRNIQVGKSFSDVIDRELESTRCVIVLWSNASAKSDWVLAEAAEGAARKILIPIQIADGRLPLEFRRLHTANLVGWRGGRDHPAIGECLAAVTDLVRGGATPARFTSSHNEPPKAQSTSTTSVPLTPRKTTFAVGWIIVAVLTVMWLGGLTFRIGGSLIHLLVIVAIIMTIVGITARMRKTV